ncbi:hypothetical protein JCM6882_003051 [Rhodosporidiobolus microsporus]
MNIIVRPFYGRVTPMTLDLNPSSTCGEAHALIRKELQWPDDDPFFRSELICDSKAVDEAKTLEESGITASSVWFLGHKGDDAL